METKNKREIGDKIKQQRTKRGLTQETLARKSDIPYATLTKIEIFVQTIPKSNKYEQRREHYRSNSHHAICEKPQS